MEQVGGFARLVCGRWTKWIVIVVWFVLFGALGSLAGKLNGALTNDAAQWLPGKAEATQVFALQREFSTSEVNPAIVVYERTSGLTAEDNAKVSADAAKLGSLEGTGGPVSAPIVSQDGQAVFVVVPIKFASDGTDWPKIKERLDAIREVTGKGDAGLGVFLAGPAGLDGAQNEAFTNIDGKLLFSTVIVVVLILLITYRSPVLWLLPLFAVGAGMTMSQAIIYLLAKHADLTVNGQSTSILTVLVFGAGTDYALLLIARYREELRKHEDRHEAMAVALHRASPAIIASAATVAAGMLCLLFAEMNSTSGLGPVAAIGIGAALLAMVTLLPALLVIFGRWVFWPVKPKVGSPEPSANGFWSRLGVNISGKPRIVWIGTAVVLGVLALGLTQLQATGLKLEDSFVTKPSALVGQDVIGKHYPGGQGQPVVVIGKAAAADQLKAAVSGTEGVASVADPVVKGDKVKVEATLKDQPDSDAAEATVLRVRDAVHKVSGADAKVGGPTAIAVDLRDANEHDNKLIIPLVLLVILVIIGLLLRAVVAPLVLIATVVLSFGAALGVSVLVFEHIFGFNGSDSSFPLLVFVFLVALGIDYNIFMMTRVREEAQRHGSRRGALIGLSATGGVITSAGLVLAATFAVLGTLPLVAFAELGFAVAFGVLLDTFIVRSVLVTALNLDLGKRMWWPSKLASQDDSADLEVGEKPVLVS